MQKDNESQKSASTTVINGQDKRIKQNSSMNYQEYVKTFHKPPQCHKLRPMKNEEALQTLEKFSLDQSRTYAVTDPVQRNNTLFNQNQEYNLDKDDEQDEENINFDEEDGIGGISKSLIIKNKFNNNIQIPQQQQNNNQNNDDRLRSQSEQKCPIFGYLERKRQQSTIVNMVM